MTPAARPRLSIVIPAYNEESRIVQSLERVAAFLSGGDAPRGGAEVLVVDDGSTDGTPAAVERFEAGPASKAASFRLLRNGTNRGKGYSIKHGVLMAGGEFVLVSDADFSTPIEELPRLLLEIASGNRGIAIGSRGLPESRVEIHQPAWRETMGRCFNALVRVITGLRFKDTQCGFKVMRRDAVLPLFRAARIERFAYDVELLYLARKAGVAVVEIPVIWRDAPGSKVRALSDSLDMLKDIVTIVIRDRRGRYAGLDAAPPGAGAVPPAGGGAR